MTRIELCWRRITDDLLAQDNELYIGVVNKSSGGETAKLATRLSPEQIALFRMVLDEILRDDRNAEKGVDIISAMNATQLWVRRSFRGGGGWKGRRSTGFWARSMPPVFENVSASCVFFFFLFCFLFVCRFD